MDFQSASTELTGAIKKGASGTDAEGHNAESVSGENSTGPLVRIVENISPLRKQVHFFRAITVHLLAQRAGIAPTISLVERLPFYLIASLLSAPAMAKVWMLLTDPFADIRAGIPKEILWGTVVFELWLAFENLRIRDQRVLASIDVSTFSAFAIFAGVRWALGYASCGCAGNFEVPPWFFLLIDIGIVLGFLSSALRRSLVFDGWHELANWWNGWSAAARGRLAGLLFFVGFIGFLQLPIAATLRASVFGELPILATVKLDGELIVGKESVGNVEIWNRSGRPAKIIGLERSCKCFGLTEGPIAKIIAPNGHISVSLVISPENPGPLHQRIVLFLDHPTQFRMDIDVFGSVKGVE